MLNRRGRITRLVATLVGAALLLTGTLVGTDDDFPFGPFRMFSTTDRLDSPVADTRVEGVDASGAPVTLTVHNTGIRRAEIEGQLDRFVATPDLLRTVASAYAARNPTAPPIVEISIVVRWHELRDGLPTGAYHDETRVVWRP
jgi:hypothetical protein